MQTSALDGDVTVVPEEPATTDHREATPIPPTPAPGVAEVFTAAMEAEVCRRVLGARSHGLPGTAAPHI